MTEFWSGLLGLELDMEVVKANRPRIVALLAEYGGTFSALLPEVPESGMWEAAKNGDLVALRKAVDGGADLDRLDGMGISPLSWASIMGEDAAVTLLLDAGADIDRQNGDGGTPLHAAAFLGRASTVTLLLKMGADRDVRNNNGLTALNTIAGGWNPQMRGIVEYVANLLKFKVDPEAVGQAWPGIIEQLRSRVR